MRSRFYTVGAWCWIVTGSVHDALDAMTRIRPPESEAALNATMKDMPFDFFGLSRNYYEVNMGISLGMGLAMVVVGLLFLFIGKVAQDAGTRRQAAKIGLVASLAPLALAVAWLPPPPIITFGLASVCFAAAVRASTHVVHTESVATAGASR